MRQTAHQLDATFAALADPTRRAILTRLLEGDLPVGTLAEPFDLTLAGVSKHLQILMRAGLVTTEKRGREKWCALNPDAIAPAARWIEAFGAWGADDYDALERALAPILDQPSPLENIAKSDPSLPTPLPDADQH